MPLDRSSCLGRACLAIRRAYLLDRAHPGAWLSAAGELLMELGGEQVSALLLVVRRGGAGGALAPGADQAAPSGASARIEHAGVAGVPSPETARALLDESHRGWPSDDVTRLGAGAACAARAAMVAERAWNASSLRRFRAELGLGEFVRAQVPFEDVDGGRTLVLQIDGPLDRWSPSDELVLSLAHVAPGITEAYILMFVRPRVVRRRLLERLSPVQRTVAPLLAAGHTEKVIARLLDRSAHTVHEHAKAIYLAWGVRNRFELRDRWLGLDSEAVPAVVVQPGAGLGTQARRTAT